METQADWGRRSTIAAWSIGIPSLALGILAYFRPPDPAHPIQFDFLSKSITLPLWAGAFSIIAMVAACAIYARWRLSRAKSPASTAVFESTVRRLDKEQELATVKEKLAIAERTIAQLSHQAKPAYSFKAGANVEASLQVMKKPFPWDQAMEKVAFTWREGFSIEVEPLTSGTYGLVARVVNNSGKWIGVYTAVIMDANSWSGKHEKFLDSRSFQQRQFTGGSNLGPDHRTTDAKWLVRVHRKGEKLCLALADNEDGLLVWPNNDPTQIEIWCLTLMLEYEATPDDRGNATALPTVFLLIKWDRTSGMIQMLKMAGPEEW